MKRVKRMVLVLAVVLVLVSGAVTVYAVSADAGRAFGDPAAVAEDYAAEEMAVEAYYENWTPEAEGEMV